MTIEMPAARRGETPVGAPFAGALTLLVADGDRVHAGQRIAIVEAMKMEAGITAPGPGVLVRAAADGPVEGGDLLAVIR